MTQPIISVAILNYRRQSNVLTIVETLRQQTMPAKILVWDNSGSEEHIPGADLIVRASTNMFCWPRWLLLAQSGTEFCMTLDDDLNLATPTALESILGALEDLDHPRQIVGPEGVVLHPGQHYFPERKAKTAIACADGAFQTTQHIVRPQSDVRVDVVKGRCMATRTDALRKLPMLPPYADMCDDIAVSAVLSGTRRRAHRVPKAFGALFSDLPGKNAEMALSARSDWKNIREAARQTYFPHR